MEYNFTPDCFTRHNGNITISLGLPFLFFIPGYMLIFILFPRKKNITGIEGLERIGLSFGFSIAIVSLLGLILNYTPWGIRLEPILLSLFFLIESLGLIALYRWKTTNPDQRFTISLDTSQFKSSNKIENHFNHLFSSINLHSRSLNYLYHRRTKNRRIIYRFLYSYAEWKCNKLPTRYFSRRKYNIYSWTYKP